MTDTLDEKVYKLVSYLKENGFSKREAIELAFLSPAAHGAFSTFISAIEEVYEDGK